MLRRCGRRRWIDLDHGADHHNLPVGPRVGDAREQREIHPFVDDAEEPEARAEESPPGPVDPTVERRACAKCWTSTLLGKAWML